MNRLQPVSPPRSVPSTSSAGRWKPLLGSAPLLLVALLVIGAGDPPNAAVSPSPERVVAAAGNSPSLVMDEQGRGVVTWLSSSFATVFARRYLGDVAQGSVLRANNISQGDLRDPKVSMDGDGNFIIVWSDVTPAPQVRTAIRGQLFAADGSRRGRELALSPRDVGAAHPAVAMAADGRFAVGWDQSHWDPHQSVRFATFAADGSRLAAPKVMDGHGTLANTVGAVTASHGSVAVAWTEFTPCPSNPIDPVSAVLSFDWSLRALREVDRLANDNPCLDGPVVKAMTNSNEGPMGVFEGRRYSIQRFSHVDGKRMGLRINVAEFPPCGRCEQVEAVGGDASGRFVFVWERVRWTSAGYRWDLLGQLFSREGVPVGQRFPVSAKVSTQPQFPAAAFASDGTLLVTWQRNGGPIVLRRFLVAG